MITVRKATREDAAIIGAQLRAADAAEMQALGYDDPVKAVLQSFDDSVECWVGFADGAPLAIVGYAVAHVISREAYPWIVTTHHVDSHKIAFARASKKFVPMLRAEFATLENWVDARYATCVDWLKWLGFEVEAAIPIMPHGLAFHRFTMKGTA
jgi:hypothetical protein